MITLLVVLGIVLTVFVFFVAYVITGGRRPQRAQTVPFSAMPDGSDFKMPAWSQEDINRLARESRDANPKGFPRR